MKKLMVAFVAMAMAIVASAATVNWKVEGIQINGSWEDADGDSAAGYLVCLFDNSTFAQDSLVASLTTADWQASFDNKIASYVGNEDGAGYVPNLTAADGDFTGYMVILDASTLDEAKNAFVTTTYIANDNSVHNIDFVTFDDESTWVNATGTWTALGAESVPEPTSALMLLVGLAGLALKRKVA